MKLKVITILTSALLISVLINGFIMADIVPYKASDIVEKFVGTTTDIDYNCEIGNIYDVYTSREDIFYINKNNRRIEGALFNSRRLNSEKQLLSSSQALQYAQKFVEKTYPNFTLHDMELVSQKFIKHDSAGNEYQFIWGETLTDIVTPNTIVISVNPNSGEIMEYIGIERLITISIKQSVIPRDEAIEIATKVLKNIDIKKVTAIQAISSDSNNQQRLIWNVNIEGYPINDIIYGGIVTVDANNGAILLIDPYL